MSIFLPMITSLFAGPLAKDATYKQGSAAAFDIRVMIPAPDEVLSIEGIEVIQKSRAFDVMKSAIDQPQKGDILTLWTGEEFKIRTWICPDDDRLLWRLFP